MKRTFRIIAVLLGIVMITTVASAQQLTASKLWFPGGPGSQWTYRWGNLTTTIKPAENIELNSRMYSSVKEDSFFPLGDEFSLFVRLVGFLIGDITGDEVLEDLENKINPFLTFRKVGDNQVRGYGVEANKTIEEYLQRTFDAKDVRSSDEWILLENPETGYRWTVAKVEAEAFWDREKITCTVEIKGEVLSAERYTGSLIVSYKSVLKVNGMIVEREERFPKGNTDTVMFLEADVGFTWWTNAYDMVELIGYQIAPNHPVPFPKTYQWFPKGKNAQWTYDTYPTTTVNLSKDISFNGKIYNTVIDNGLFDGMFNNGHGVLLEFNSPVTVNPFSASRIVGNSQIRGYGVEANKALAENLLEYLSFKEEDIKFPSGDEWILLEDPTTSDDWTVAKVEAEGISGWNTINGWNEVKVHGVLELKAYVRKGGQIFTPTGLEFPETLVVSYYESIDVTEAETGTHRDSRNQDFGHMWLAPNVGLVQFWTRNNVPVELIAYGYQLFPGNPLLPQQPDFSFPEPRPEQAVKSIGKRLTTWGYIRKQ